jgi:hypothetical protein
MAEVGIPVLCSTGTWTGPPDTYAYQWQRGPTAAGPFTNIAGATASSYTPVDTDDRTFLRCQVTARNLAGVATATSNVDLVGEVVIAGELGCGSYDAYILPRGGGSIVAPVPWSQLSWSRVLDDTSAASLDATGGVEATCAPALRGVLPWRHELAIYRDGVLVWVGPLTAPASQPGQDAQALHLDARDLSAWLDHRRIHNDHDYSTVPADIATIFQAVVADAMAPDNSPGLNVVTTPTGILGSVILLAEQQLIAGPSLRDLANAGIDWTIVKRAVLAGGTSVTAGDLGNLTDDNFATPPKVTFDGTTQANLWAVVGAGTGTDGNAIFATAGDADAAALDGLLESVQSVSTLQDYDSVLAAAESNLALGRRQRHRGDPLTGGTGHDGRPDPRRDLHARARGDDPARVRPVPAVAGHRDRELERWHRAGLMRLPAGGNNVSQRRLIVPGTQSMKALLQTLGDRVTRLERGGVLLGRVSLGPHITIGGINVDIVNTGGGHKNVVFTNPTTGTTFTITL